VNWNPQRMFSFPVPKNTQGMIAAVASQGSTPDRRVTTRSRHALARWAVMARARYGVYDRSPTSQKRIR